MSIQTFSSQKQTQKTMDFRQKYKTERCRFWYQKGFCPFNKFCAFAHNEDEMREKNAFNLKYKTKQCHNFFEHGFCKYGDRCQYIHSQTIRSQKQGDKTRSNSQQSYSSRSSSQDRSHHSSFPHLRPDDSKYQSRYDMLKENEIELFDIMMGRSLWIKSLVEGQSAEGLCLVMATNDGAYAQVTFSRDAEYCCGVGMREQKKFRMYSM